MNPVINNTRKTVDPSLADLLNLHKKDIFTSMNCHHLATIQSFDNANQTVQATINYKKSKLERDSNGIYSTILVDYPVLIDCPIISLFGGPSGLTMPIQKGDTCLLLFNDRSIDNWFQTGQVAGLSSARLHAFSDAIALVGVRSLANKLTTYDSSNPVLYNGSTKITVKSAKVKLENGTTTLNTLLQDLITQIKAITTTNAVVGSPCAISATSQTALANIATQISGLLE